jgi:long-chain fatty acid transport protein
MKKTLFLIASLSLAAGSALAGGLVTNTNQSAHFLRNPARDASTEIDAVYTNPAGLTFLADGFHLSLTNQSAFQTRTITSTFGTFAYNGGSATKTYEGETNSPIIPSFQFAYKKNAWVLSGQFAIIGGGGKVTFDKGLPSFEAKISTIPYGLTAAGLTTTAYSTNCSMEGHQYIYGFQLNGSYKISEAFSAGVGLRLNIVNNGYKGHLTDIQINPVYAGNPTGAMMSAPTFFTSIGNTTQATATADKQIDCSQMGIGYSPILSVNYHVEGLNLSAKYEFRSAIEVENDTKVDDTGLYPDGVKTANDIPAFLSVGAAYDLTSKWKLTGGYHHFFDSDAKMANDKQQYIDGGLNEYLLGSEYAINEMFLVSAGAQITRTAVTDAYQSDLSYSLSSYSVGFGGAVKITPDLRLNLGYFFTNYSDWTKKSDNYNGTSVAGTDVYARTNTVLGLALDYKF